MPNSVRDPIQVVKAYLGEATLGSSCAALSTIGPDLREIQARLARACQVEGRISLSEAIQALLGAGDSSVA